VGIGDTIGSGGVSQIAKFSLWNSGLDLVKGAAGHLSWILIVLGAIHYYLRLSLGPESSGLIVISSLVLLVVGLYAISSRLSKDKFAVIIPVLLFFIWYVVFQARIDSSFLMYYLPTVALLLILPVLITRGQSIAAEGAGFLVVLVYFLDVGFINWLVNHFDFNLTELMINLVLFMPWWSYLGLFTLPSESTESKGINALIQITKVIGIIYIIFVVVAPSIPDLGRTSSLIPSVGEFEQSQVEFRQKYAKTQNPFLINLQCIWEGYYKDVPGCVKEKQEEKQLAYICEFQEKVSKTTNKGKDFEKCIKEQRNKKKESLNVAGSVDKTIKQPTKIKFKENEYFPKLVTKKKGEISHTNYPVEFIIENPREQKINIDLSCEFKTKGGIKETIKGEIKGDKSIISNEKEIRKTIVCQSTEKLKGKYDLIYSSELANLQTNSILRRAFIGKKDYSWKEEWFPKLKATYFSGRSYLSKAPADLARLNFAFGSSVNNPIISDENFLILSSSIENLGDGEISKINFYHIGLDDFSVDDEACFGKKNIDLSNKKIKGIETLKTCLIEELPSELIQPMDFVIKEFTGELNYNYKITKKIPIEIKVIDINAGQGGG